MYALSPAKVRASDRVMVSAESRQARWIATLALGGAGFR